MNRVLLLAGLAAAAACGDRDTMANPKVEPAVELRVLVDPPAFSLRDQAGVEFGRKDLDGHVTLAGFVFTRCQSVCPVITLRMRKLQEETRSRGAAVQLLSFSVDPEHDTPEVLAAYARKASADPTRWRFLTGDPAEVRRVVTGTLMMSMSQDGTLQPNGAPDIIHSQHIALFDRRGRVRGFYDSSEPDRLAMLARDIDRLLAE